MNPNIEIDITGAIKEVKDIRNFIKEFKVNYSNYSKKLKHNYSKFRLLRFTIIYLLVCAALCAVVFSYMLAKNFDGTAIAIILVLPWIPYFVILIVFLPLWFLQQIYLMGRTILRVTKLITKRCKKS